MTRIILQRMSENRYPDGIILLSRIQCTIVIYIAHVQQSTRNGFALLLIYRAISAMVSI